MNLPCKPGKRVHGWHFHKHAHHAKSKRLNKLEQYILLPVGLRPALLKFLQSQQFQWTEDATRYPRVFSILKALEGTEHNGKGKPPRPFGEHFYRTHFSRVMLHREQPYLVRVYELTSLPNGVLKLEITFLDEHKEGSRRIVGHPNPHHKLRAMREFKERIEKRFPLQESWVFEDHSNGQPVEEFVRKLLKHAAQEASDVHTRMMHYIERNGGMRNISDLF